MYLKNYSNAADGSGIGLFSTNFGIWAKAGGNVRKECPVKIVNYKINIMSDITTHKIHNVGVAEKIGLYSDAIEVEPGSRWLTVPAHRVWTTMEYYPTPYQTRSTCRN
jgi:hypothetical protein